MRILPAAATAFGVAIAICHAANAQTFNPNLIGGVMAPVVINPCLSSSPCGSARGSDAASRHIGRGRTTASVLTTYRADPVIAARVRRQFLAFVAHTSGAQGSAELSQAFAKTDPIAAWARQAAPDGMRLGDVSDAMAEYWVSNWLMANHLIGDAPPASVREVRDQVRRALISNPAFGRLDNGQRQELAETSIYNTILQGSIYHDAANRHDEGLLQRMSDAAVVRFRNETHIDLRMLTLSLNGFQPRL